MSDRRRHRGRRRRSRAAATAVVDHLLDPGGRRRLPRPGRPAHRGGAAAVGFRRRRRHWSCPTARRWPRRSRRPWPAAPTCSSPPAAPASRPPTAPPRRPAPLLDREVPGLAEAIRAPGSRPGVPTAALSRGLAGSPAHPRGQPAGVDRRACATRWGCSAAVLAARALPGPGRRPLMAGVARRAAGRETPVRTGSLLLDPLRRRDRTEWIEVRSRNRHWLGPWDATSPGPRAARYSLPGPRARTTGPRHGRAGCCPFVIRVDGRLVGQMVRLRHRPTGRCCRGRRLLGRPSRSPGGIAPTALALAGDHPSRPIGLHRHRGQHPPREHRQPGGRAQAGLPRRRGAARIPPHRRGLARPPDLRADHRGPRAAGPCSSDCTPITPVTLATHRPTSPDLTRRHLTSERAAQQSDLPRHHGGLGCLFRAVLGASPRAPRHRALGRPVLRVDARPRAPQARCPRPTCPSRAPFVCREPGPRGPSPGPRQARRDRAAAPHRCPATRCLAEPATVPRWSGPARRSAGLIMLGALAAVPRRWPLLAPGARARCWSSPPGRRRRGAVAWLESAVTAERAARVAARRPVRQAPGPRRMQYSDRARGRAQRPPRPAGAPRRRRRPRRG